MKYLNGVTEFLQANLLAALPIVLIAFVVTGYFMFYSSTIDPALRNRDQVMTQLATARKSIVDTRGLAAVSPAELQSRLVSTQATLAASSNILLSPAQASQITDALYQYAEASHVTITDLVTQPPATPSDKAIVSITTARLIVQGDSHQLVEFVSRIKEASAKGFVIDNLSIAQDKAGAKLTMDIALYTSLLAENPPRPTGQPTSITPAASAAKSPSNNPPPASSAQSPSKNPPPANAAQLIPAPSHELAPAIVPTAVPRLPKATSALPTATLIPPTPTPRLMVYLVRVGDTLSLVAHRFGTTNEALIAANGLLSSDIRHGQFLLVPAR